MSARKLFVLILGVLLSGYMAVACFPPETMAQEALQIIDTPTAGVLPRGMYQLHMRLFPRGGVLFGADVALADRLMIGLSYGGENIIGLGQVHWNPYPGAHVRARIIDESLLLPAITLGFQSQGYGSYLDSYDRYEVKSRGFFAVASRHYRAGFLIGLHGGVNYSLEKDDDDDLNAFAGTTFELSPQWVVLGEYDFAWNDNAPGGVGRGNGFFNVGIRWQAAEHLSIDFVFYNLVHNRRGVDYAARLIMLRYWERI